MLNMDLSAPIQVTNASVHDSKMFAQVFDFNNQDDDIWADSAYYNVNFENVT